MTAAATSRVKPPAFSVAERRIIETYYPRFGVEITARALKQKGFLRSCNSIKSFCFRNRIKREDCTRFKHGQTPYNKGKKLPEEVRQKIAPSQFKPGHKLNKNYPIGTVHEWGGYQYIKIAEPKVWKLYHHYVWEQVHGAIPKRHVLVFRDGDTQNVQIQNLILLTRQQHAQRNADRITDSARKASRIKAVQTRKRNASARRRRELRDKYGSISEALAMGEKL